MRRTGGRPFRFAGIWQLVRKNGCFGVVFLLRLCGFIRGGAIGAEGVLGYHAAVSARESHIACMPVAPHCAGKGLTKKAGGAMLVLQKRGACRCRLRGGGKRPDPEPDADNAAVGGEHAQCVCWVHRRVYLFLVLFARRRGRPGKQRGSALGFFFTTAGHLNSEGARVSG